MKCVIDHENVFFFLTFLRTCYKSLNNSQSLCDSFCTTCCIVSGHTASQLLQVSCHTNFLYEYMNPLKKPPERVVCKLENVLQRNHRTDRARECIFRTFLGTNFENVPARGKPWCCLHEFDVGTGYVWIRPCTQTWNITQTRIVHTYNNKVHKYTYIHLWAKKQTNE